MSSSDGREDFNNNTDVSENENQARASVSRGLKKLLARSIRPKLLALFGIAVLTAAALLFAALLMTGAISVTDQRGVATFNSELDHLSNVVERRMGELSALSLQMSRMLASGTERFLTERNIKTDELQRHADVLSALLTSQFDVLMLSLQRAKATGAFFILNATASLRLQEAANFRAGLYLVNLDPAFPGGSILQYQLLRGPSDVALSRGLALEKEWAMEFNILGADYFSAPQQMAEARPDLADRLSLWFPAQMLRGAMRRIMLCSAPLVDSNGAILGVCGFDVSDLHFRRAYAPSPKLYEGTFCALAPARDAGLPTARLDMNGALMSWRWLDSSKSESDAAAISHVGKIGDLAVYRSRNGDEYVGGERALRTQPSDVHERAAAISDIRLADFVFVLLTPKGQFDAERYYNALRLAVPFVVATIAGLVLSIVFSRLYMRPIQRAVQVAKEGGDDIPLTHIDELDEIIEYLTNLNSTNKHYSERMSAAGAGENSEEQEFKRRAETLSPAERSVLDLCLQGLSANDIAAILKISPNTVKSHNRNIFDKMGAGSQRELLMMYIRILKGTK